MVITAVEPALLADGAASHDLEDVTHRCVQCGTTIIRTVPSLSGVACTLVGAPAPPVSVNHSLTPGSSA